MTTGRRARPVCGPREIVYQTPYQRLYRVVADFGAFTKEYFVNDFGPNTAVVVTRGDDILLCRQYRLLMGRTVWEVPGGGARDGERLEEAAIRECLEETGIRCRSVTLLLHFNIGDGYDNPTYVFHAKEFAEQPIQGDGQEAVARAWTPLRRCIEMVFRREITDHRSIVALLAYQVFRWRGGRLPRPRRGRQGW